ncbi:MAG: PQQ-binding-like beta-propeller repeat protein [Verrucomicrobiota bacterium]
MPSPLITRTLSGTAYAGSLFGAICLFSLPAATPLIAQTPSAAANEAAAILESSGIKGGIILQIGLSNKDLPAALRINDSFQVQAIDPDEANVIAARSAIKATTTYGPVAAATFNGKQLPYIDNLINLAVVESLGAIPLEEVLRVLTPNGVLMLKKDGVWTKTTKPKPSGLDDWTHYYYSAKGNAVSRDEQVGPPERMQWVGNPRWSRHHDRMSSVSAEVSSNGRLFYIMDEGSRVSILLPSKWSLIARDAFNGTILWKKPIANWSDHLWPLKSGPTQLTRRLVGDGDRIFVASELLGPVRCLDGATGNVIREFPETKGTEEILHVDGVLYLLVNKNDWGLKDYAPKQENDQKRANDEFQWDKKPRQLMAVDTNTGKVLWEQEALCAPITLGTDGKSIVYYNGSQVICLDASNGKPRWDSAPQKTRQLEYSFGPRVVIYNDTVMYTGGGGVESALDLNTGKALWSGSRENSAYRSPEDMIVAGGLVWSAGTTSGNQTGEFTGRDPKTGEVKKKFAPDVPKGTYWFHHRCYIAKATEKFIMPSRTGIEYVDIDKEHWNLNHWVRGACLYGVLPANGLTYAGPHNCACYPEAKLDGMNALAPNLGSPHPAPLPDDQRLVFGLAWKQPIEETEADPKDWPTFRHDNARSGFSNQPVAADMKQSWEISLPGRLSAITVAAGKLFISQIDTHTLHALDHATGKSLWQFTANARIDSPPTFWKGRVFFGGNDGWIYCVRATDGVLIWKFLAAPSERKHGAWEQMESVWPVHGSVLVENGTVNAVAGRSVFLDGGLRFIRLDALTGKKLAEQIYDKKDPETGGDFQDRHKTLQMPVGSNDILSSDGTTMYLRSQKIGSDGVRVDIGPVSGNAAQQGGAQKGDGRHLFAPMGFLDDSWFHRSYWVYGKNFAGGHNGYYQAGKYTPEGRLLVHDDENVYGFARDAKYLKWTTTMEHQLFCSTKEAPNVEVKDTEGAKAKEAAKKATDKTAKTANPSEQTQAAPAKSELPSVAFRADKLQIANTPLSVEMWVLVDGKDGVLAQQGGARMGYALAIQEGRPGFTVRSEASEIVSAQAQRPLDEGWHHLTGVLADNLMLRLFVDGQLAAETSAKGLITKQPALGLQLGAPNPSSVSDYGKNAPYFGMIDQFAIYKRALKEEEIVDHANSAMSFKDAEDVLLAVSFDNGSARDESGHGIDGLVKGVDFGKGKVATGLWFRKPSPKDSALAASTPGGAGALPPMPKSGSAVQHTWEHPVGMFPRAMAMGGKNVFLSGPQDSINEEYALEQISKKDPAILEQLKEQDAALDGKRGATLLSVSTESGKVGQEIKLSSPPVWDGMSVARGRVFVATEDGKIICYGGKDDPELKKPLQ